MARGDYLLGPDRLLSSSGKRQWVECTWKTTIQADSSWQHIQPGPLLRYFPFAQSREHFLPPGALAWNHHRDVHNRLEQRCSLDYFECITMASLMLKLERQVVSVVHLQVELGYSIDYSFSIKSKHLSLAINLFSGPQTELWATRHPKMVVVSEVLAEWWVLVHKANRLMRGILLTKYGVSWGEFHCLSRACSEGFCK